mmetsp:Transcript_3690/g.7933  ORF Transcript_3690/g.7933 Transcript_3690/m.7933 type:complete len:97 (-) Transcript_3690:473-763(-)
MALNRFQANAIGDVASAKEILERRLKKIDSNFFKDNPTHKVPRFVPYGTYMREAKMLLTLSHPNIIRIQGIMGYVERPGNCGIIMNKLRSTLQEHI